MADNAIVQVIDMLGRVLISCEANSSLLTPNSSLKPGVYVIRVIEGNNIRTQKIVR